jgi:uncharacterized membrane protein
LKQFIPVIADFGGLLGLFLGCSLLSIAEIIFLLIHLFIKSSKIQDNVVKQERIEKKIELSRNEANY